MANGAQYLTGAGEGEVRQWFGVYYGYIAVNLDPTSKGRVKLRVPQVLGNTTSGWALPMVAVSYIPKVGTGVSVMFVGGDPTQPVWFGNFAIPGGSAGMVIAATEPADPQLAEVWVNSATGLMSEWNGAAWVPYQIGGAAIQPAADLQEPNIIGGTITGSQFIADGTAGEFLGYTGSPASGNMNVSVSPVPGSDSKGNAYLDGVTVYYNGAHIQVHVNSFVGAPAVEMLTGASSEAGGAALYTWSPNKGAANEVLDTFWQGPTSTSDGKAAAINMVSSAKDGSTQAQGNLNAGNTIATWDASGFHVLGELYGNNGLLTVADPIQANSDIHVSGKLYGVSGTVTVGDSVTFQQPISAGTGWANMVQGGDLVLWTIGGGGVARYKKMPDNTVMVQMTNALTNGVTTAGQAIWATPWPLTNGATQNFPVYWIVSGASPALPQQPFVYMSGGDLFIGYLPSNVLGVSFLIRYAID